MRRKYILSRFQSETGSLSFQPSTAMKVLKVLQLIVLFAAIYCDRGTLQRNREVAKEKFMSFYVKDVRCEFSEKYFHKNISSCWAKSYNRTFSTINMIAVWIKPSTQIFVSNFAFAETRKHEKFKISISSLQRLTCPCSTSTGRSTAK